MDMNRLICSPRTSVGGESCIQPLYKVDPRMHATVILTESFPNGLLGYMLAEETAKRLGNKELFDYAIEQILLEIMRQLDQLSPGQHLVVDLIDDGVCDE